MRAQALVIVELVVGDGALAADVVTFYHGRRDDTVHKGARPKVAAARLALLSRELRKASAAS